VSAKVKMGVERGDDVFIPHLLDGMVSAGSRDVEKICLWSAVGLTALTTPCRGHCRTQNLLNSE
jgi:hypothetical protein